MLCRAGHEAFTAMRKHSAGVMHMVTRMRVCESARNTRDLLLIISVCIFTRMRLCTDGCACIDAFVKPHLSELCERVSACINMSKYMMAFAPNKCHA